jgi:hypothetical protein
MVAIEANQLNFVGIAKVLYRYPVKSMGGESLPT